MKDQGLRCTIMMGLPASSVRKLWQVLVFLAATQRMELAAAYAVKGVFDRFTTERPRTGTPLVTSPQGHVVALQQGRHLYRRTAQYSAHSTTMNSTSHAAVLEKKMTTIQPFTSTISAPQSIVVKNNSVAKHIFSCLFCFSAGFGDVRAIRNFGGPVNMCTGGIVRAVLAVMERRWEDVVTPTLLVSFYVLGAIASRLTENALESKRCEMLNDVNTIQSIGRSTGTPFSMSPWLWLVSRSSKMSILCLAVIPLILGVFGVATLKHQCLHTCVAAQAFGFGLIHTTAQEVTGGSVVFAVTGHAMVASKAAADVITSSSSSTAKKSLVQRTTMIFSFATGVAVAAVLWDYVLPLFCGSSRLEHILMGVWYSIIFFGCSQWV